MQVRRTRGLDGARGAHGTVVVIDVLRAFTTAAFAFASGARTVELVRTPEEAFARRAQEPELVLVGEVGGRPIPGFDHGNSPERMASLALAGRALVLRSSSGVQGAVTALATCRHLFLGSFVTAAATVRAIRALGPAAEAVTLVAMGALGAESHLDGPEDDACAELLEARLAERTPDWPALERRVRSGPSARAALDPREDWISPGDLACALALDRHDFAIRVGLEAGRIVARPVDARGA